jgi:hypothetical protein
MQKIKNKSGLALGTIVALVGSLLTVSPAQANTETSMVLFALGAGADSQNSMVITEPFEMGLRYGSSVAGNTGVSGSGTVQNGSVHYVVSAATASVLVVSSSPAPAFSGASNSVTLIPDNATAANDGHFVVSSTSAFLALSLKADQVTSRSSAVTVTLTPFIDNDGLSGFTAGDSKGTAYTINFVPWSALGASVTLAQPTAHDRGATASITVTAGTIRWSQLNGFFSTRFTHTGDTGSTNSASVSGVAGADSATIDLSGQSLATLGYSYSAAVITGVFTTSPTVGSVSAQVFYVNEDTARANTTGFAADRGLTEATKLAVTERTAAGVTISPVAGSNIRQTGAGTGEARPNSEFTVQAFAHTTSVTTSMAVTKSVTVSAVGAGLQFGAAAGVILNGVTYTSSGALRAAGFTLGASTDRFTASTFGQEGIDGTDTLDLRVTAQGMTATLVITLNTPSFTAVYVPTAVAGLAGQTLSFNVSVVDQWKVTPVRTDLRIKAVMVLSSSESEAVGTVTAGAATINLAPLPATRTGSGTVTFTVQVFDQGTQTYVATGTTDSATWNVYSYAAGTDAFTGRSATASASVSYGVSGYSWSGVVAVGVANSFSNVAVSAPGLVIENNDQTTSTGSGTLTVAANGKTANLRFAGTKPGTYTVTFTQGSNSTTSIITISAAGSDRGSTFSFDTTAIESGKTKQIVGTLRDANGNPVDTTLPGTVAGDSGTASILISVVGTAGIVATVLPTETDANGQFKLSVLTAAAENGTLVITATYYRGSTATATFTATQTVTVTPAATPEVNAVIGSFNGRLAVRVENAKGSVVSVKAGKKWVKFNSLNNNYLYTMKAVRGSTIAVSVWVDGELQNSQTITIK